MARIPYDKLKFLMNVDDCFVHEYELESELDFKYAKEEILKSGNLITIAGKVYIVK